MVRGSEHAMIDRYFDKPHVRKRLKAGPLAGLVEAYLAQMEMLGYEKLTIQLYVQAIEHFAGWLERRGLTVRSTMRMLQM